jgi:NAD(P)-dependent dehydrogenase (short-subunit alcohol dehydrogenase family)
VRKKSDAERLQKELGPHFTPLIFDVTDGKAVKKAAAYVAAQMKGRCLFGLVNNAGEGLLRKPPPSPSQCCLCHT